MHPAIETSHVETASPRIWQPWTWRDYEARQQPEWDGPSHDMAIAAISSLPPLVSAHEIETLKERIAQASKGNAFLLQGGDCAERFQDCNEEHISGRLKILMQMGLVIGYGTKTPVIPIGRMAGQYAKPRSELLEQTSDGLLLNAFRGENVNSFLADVNQRKPDANRLIQSYHYSGATLNFIRTVMNEGFADLRNLDQWHISNMQKTLSWAKYEKIVKGLKEFFSLLQHFQKRQDSESFANHDQFYVSHEALLLSYEEALTRYVPSMGRWYNLGAHFLWIGDRTRNLDSAHIEYCRGIGNPIGIKVGSDADPKEIAYLVKHLNPHNEMGKINLITRFGAAHVKRCLPNLIEAIQYTGSEVAWSVDPMHGNTHKTECGYKTRDFSKMSDEVEQSFLVHKKYGSHLGGVHLEMTHDSVTECLGGSEFIEAKDLPKKYETWCDPRLSGAQALELSFLISSLISHA